jgi:hypothetical protein
MILYYCLVTKVDRSQAIVRYFPGWVVTRRKAGEQGVSSDEDPSPEPSWSGDVASAAVDWSNMLRSSRLRRSAAPRCCRHASLGRRGVTRLWARGRVRRLPLPDWAFGRPAPVRRPAEWALPSRRDRRLVRSIPLGGRRSDRCNPPAL